MHIEHPRTRFGTHSLPAALTLVMAMAMAMAMASAPAVAQPGTTVSSTPPGTATAGAGEPDAARDSNETRATGETDTEFAGEA